MSAKASSFVHGSHLTKGGMSAMLCVVFTYLSLAAALTRTFFFFRADSWLPKGISACLGGQYNKKAFGNNEYRFSVQKVRQQRLWLLTSLAVCSGCLSSFLGMLCFGEQGSGLMLDLECCC